MPAVNEQNNSFFILRLAEQIDQLFEICKKHYVPYYDVQVELVDQLANAVEEQTKEIQNIFFRQRWLKIFNKSSFAV